MNNYQKIFEKPTETIDKKTTIPAIEYRKEIEHKRQKNHENDENTQNCNHDIKFHLEKIRKYQTTDEIEDPVQKKLDSIKRLRKLVRKL